MDPHGSSLLTTNHYWTTVSVANSPGIHANKNMLNVVLETKTWTSIFPLHFKIWEPKLSNTFLISSYLPLFRLCRPASSNDHNDKFHI